MRDWQPHKQVEMWGALTPLNAPQMTDVATNRWREPVNRPKGTLDLQAGRRLERSFQDPETSFTLEKRLRARFCIHALRTLAKVLRGLR